MKAKTLLRAALIEVLHDLSEIRAASEAVDVENLLKMVTEAHDAIAADVEPFEILKRVDEVRGVLENKTYLLREETLVVLAEASVSYHRENFGGGGAGSSPSFKMCRAA